MASVLQPSNRVVKTISYDALDRVLLESYGVGARENTAFSWDQHGSRNDPGQLLAVTRGTGLVAKYTYDPNARRLERSVENASLSYSLGMSDTFDVGGAIIRQRIPGGAGFGFGYDAFRRLRSITFGQGADSVPVLSDARYRSNDLVDGYRLGARLRANYGYETQRSFMTTNKVVRHPAGNPTAVQDTLLLQKLEWDASGNVAGMQRPIGDTLGYRHDRLGQLRATARAGGMDSLQYDANGNRTRHRFTLDGGVPDSLAYNANRVAWMRTARNGHTLFRHDVLGNLTLEVHFASAADTTDLSKAWKIVERKFNRRNELERVVVKDRQTMDSTLWAYDYDEAGNRIMKRYAANLDTTQWKTERRYAYDGVNVVADSGRADSSWTWHVFQGYNRLALADKPGSALRVRYLLNDHLGTANVMVDDTGRVLAKYARDPWGNLESSWESTPLRWQFTGKEQDPEVGGNVFYFNARFYDAERGSFIGRDPKLQFWTPYSYVGNGPLVGVDPTGMLWDYANMTDAELQMHDEFTSKASSDELSLYDRVTDDFSILVSHSVGPLAKPTHIAAFHWPIGEPSINAVGQKLLHIQFRSEADELADILLHETTHLVDYLNGIKVTKPVDIGIEVRAWDNQSRFLERNNLPISDNTKDYLFYWKFCGDCRARWLYDALYRKNEAYQK